MSVDIHLQNTSVFSTAAYAATWSKKIKRSLSLGPKYYFVDLPRYLRQRHRLGLRGIDWQSFINPSRSFRVRTYRQLPLPPHYNETISQLAAVGVRVGMHRCRFEALLGVWWATRDVPGEVIEFGVAGAATSLTLALLGAMNGLSQRVLMLDTFAGMPTPSTLDFYDGLAGIALPPGWVDVIRGWAKSLGVTDRIEIHQGLFSETMPNLSDRKFAFAHVDANLYESTRQATDFCVPRMNKGGAIVFDDYNGICYLGPRLAIDASLIGRQVRPTPLAESSAYLFI